MLSAPIATIIDSVVQFGFEIIPFGRFFVSFGLTSGTTNGTFGSIRNALELSTTIAPRAAAIGAHSAETSSGTSNIATSMPSKASGESATTVNSSPRHINFLPALRAEAIRRISPQTSLRSDKMPSITVPTAPVAPTTASVGFFATFLTFLLIVQFLHIQQLHFDLHLIQMRCGQLLLRAQDLFRGR